MDLIASGCTVASGANAIVTLNCVGPIIVNLLSWAFTFAGIICLIFVIFGGFKFLTSGGEKEKVEEGRKTITWALIGLVIIFLSFAIVRLVGSVTGVTCISSGSFEFGRCGLPVNTCDKDKAPSCNDGSSPVCIDQHWNCGQAGAQCKGTKPNCGIDQTGLPRDPLCDSETLRWQCSGGL